MIFGNIFQTCVPVCCMPVCHIRHGLYAQTLHQHAGTQRDTVPVTFPVQHLEEVVITAGRPGITAGAVSNRISSSEIHRAAGSSLATLLERISGVSSLSTGTTVSKPVIHGMHGNRILIINNGARQTGQQWATDHAPEVDINESSNILVIKGADGVRYGSDALGGIIVMEQPPFALGQEHPKGRIATFYGSNGHRYAATGSLEGTLPFLRNIAWRMQGTYSNSGDRSTAHYLPQYRNQRIGAFSSASAGYDSGRLQIEGIYSHFGEQTGVMFGAQMGSEDLLAERIRLGRPVQTLLHGISLTPTKKLSTELPSEKSDTMQARQVSFTGKLPGRKTTAGRIASAG